MKHARRAMLLFLALLCLGAPALGAGYWTQIPEDGIRCQESRPGCHLLQMAMVGTFAELDAQNSISVRMFSAVLPQLLGLTQEDFSHFCAQFAVEEETIRRIYHIALGNCLLADIRQGAVVAPQEAAVRRVLLLFLHPEGEEDAHRQKEIIRAEMDEAILSDMAESAGLPQDFIAYLIETEDWDALPE